MIHFPDRITALMEKLERGEALTQADADRTTTLQLLDLLKAGEDFARDAMIRDDETTKRLDTP